MTNANLDLKSSMMDLTLGGSPIMNLADIIVPLVESVLINYATKQVENELQNTLPNQFNSFVWNNDGFVRLGAIDNATFP